MSLKFEPFYQDFLDLQGAYGLALSTMTVDENTIAPKKGRPRTDEASTLLAGKLFELQHDPALIEKIEDYAKRLPESSLEKKEVDLRLEAINKERNIPADKYMEAVKSSAIGQTVWHEAKEENDYPKFRPYLEDGIKKHMALYEYQPDFNGNNYYDLALDDFEKGMNEEQYDAFFQVIKEELPPLIEKVSKAKQIDTSLMSQTFDIERQKKFMKEVMKFMQVDPDRVYLSETEHPFTDFLSSDDVRITTHYYPDAFLSAVLSTVHEYGHALYALNWNEGYDKTMFAGAIGSAAHESQSRFLENHIGRSKAFWKALKPKLDEIFPEFKDVSVDELVAMINASTPSLIRTEADELTYPLHILIRYEIEKMMAEGKLDYDKLPEIWADKYEEYLGVRPDTDKKGVLQDVHWSEGYFGYFPTYALGSAYAAQLYEKMAQDFDVEKALEEGDFSKITTWLRDNVQGVGAERTMRETVEKVSGKPFDPHIYTNYLKDKYTQLYHLDEQD